MRISDPHREQTTNEANDFMTTQTVETASAGAGSLHPLGSAIPCDHNEMVATGDKHHAWKCAKCGYIYGDQAEEEAIALGFPSAHAAKQHSDWLAGNGTPEYKAWLASISPNVRVSDRPE